MENRTDIKYPHGESTEGASSGKHLDECLTATQIETIASANFLSETGLLIVLKNNLALVRHLLGCPTCAKRVSELTENKK